MPLTFRILPLAIVLGACRSPPRLAVQVDKNLPASGETVIGAGGLLEFRLAVPHASAAITCDGETNEEDWITIAARTGAFVDAVSQRPSIPHSEARFLWDDKAFYLLLYAAHIDIRACGGASGPEPGDDVFFFSVVTDGGVELNAVFSASGAVWGVVRRDGQPEQKWKPSALGVESDGTLNDPEDDDEEWVVEAAIPWDILDIRPGRDTVLRIALKRCDTPKFATTRCGSWGEDFAGRVTGVVELQ